MSKIILKLNRSQRTLLNEVLLKRGKSCLVHENSNILTCVSSNLEQLLQVVIDEFLENGLRDNDEPNERGLKLEEIIDSIMSDTPKKKRD